MTVPKILLITYDENGNQPISNGLGTSLKENIDLHEFIYEGSRERSRSVFELFGVIDLKPESQEVSHYESYVLNYK